MESPTDAQLIADAKLALSNLNIITEEIQKRGIEMDVGTTSKLKYLGVKYSIYDITLTFRKEIL